MDEIINFFNLSGINFATSDYDSYPLDTVYFNDGINNYLVWQKGNRFIYLNHIMPLYYFYRNTKEHDVDENVQDYNYLSRFIKTSLLQDRRYGVYLETITPHVNYTTNMIVQHHMISLSPLGKGQDFLYDYTDYSKTSNRSFGKMSQYTLAGTDSNLKYYNDYSFYRKNGYLKIFLNENCYNLFKGCFFFPNTYLNNFNYNIYHDRYNYINNNYYNFLLPNNIKFPHEGVYINYNYNGNPKYIEHDYSRNLYFPYGDEYEREKEDGSIVIETDPLYKDMAHFDFRYVKNMSGMFDGLTFFKGNLNGYAACGDNVVDMSYAYRDTGVSYPKVGINVKNMDYAFCNCTLVRYECGPLVWHMDHTYANTRIEPHIEYTTKNVECRNFDATFDIYQQSYNIKDIAPYFENNSIILKYVNNGDEFKILFEGEIVKEYDAYNTQLYVYNDHGMSLVDVFTTNNIFMRERAGTLSTIKDQVLIIMNESRYGNNYWVVNGYLSNIWEYPKNVPVSGYSQESAQFEINSEAACSDFVRYLNYTYFNSDVTVPNCGVNVIDMTKSYASCLHLDYAVSGPNVQMMVGTYQDSNIATGNAVCNPSVNSMHRAYFNAHILNTATTEDTINLDYMSYCYSCNYHVYVYEEEKGSWGEATRWPVVNNYLLMLDELPREIYYGPVTNNPYDFNWCNDSKYDKDSTAIITINDHPYTWNCAYTFAKRIPSKPMSLKGMFKNAGAMQGMFYRCSNITHPTAGWASNMYRTYAYCKDIREANLNSNALENMWYTYYYCNNLIYPSNYDFKNSFSNNKDMYRTYSNCRHIIEAFPSNVELFNNTYENCKNLVIAACSDITKEFNYTYIHCPNLAVAACGNKVINMIGTFIDCDNLLEAVCSDSVINMTNTYADCNNLINTASGNNVQEMIDTYVNCSSLTKAACGINVINMINTYRNCASLENAVCGKSVVNMTSTYQACPNLINAVCGDSVVNMISTYADCLILKNAICGEKVINMINTYRNCPNLINAVCSNSVQYMDNTYRNCIVLEKAICGNNVKYMNNTYRDCTLLIEAASGPEVLYMNNTYENCNSLEIAKCGDKVKSLMGTYKGCNNLVIAACGNSVTSLVDVYSDLQFLVKAECGINVINMDRAYNNCPNLTEPAVGPKVVNMNYTFSYCNNLKNAFCPDSVRYMIGTYANCYNIVDAYVGNYIYDMSYAYSYCNNVKNIHYNNRSISYMVNKMDYSFVNCVNLEKPVLPGDAIYSTNNTFENCINLIGHNHYSQIIIYDDEKNEVLYNNNEFFADGIIAALRCFNMRGMYYNCGNLKGSAFITNRNFNYAYYNCKNINTVYVNSERYNINNGAYAFAECDNLKYLGNQYYNEVAVITLNNTITNKIYYEDENYKFYSTSTKNNQNIYFNFKFDINNIYYPTCPGIFANCKNLILPSTIEVNLSIYDSAEVVFRGCNIQKGIINYISDSSREYAVNIATPFIDCSNLYELTIKFSREDSSCAYPKLNYTNLNSAFQGMSNLTLTNIKGIDFSKTFANNSLESTHALHYYYNNVFNGCRKINKFAILPTNENVVYYGYMCNAYRNCINTPSYLDLGKIMLSFTKGVTSLDMSNAFEGCTNLLKVNLPKTLFYKDRYGNLEKRSGYVTNGIFKDCIQLNQITGGPFVALGSEALSGTGLTNVYPYCNAEGAYSNCKNIIYLFDGTVVCSTGITSPSNLKTLSFNFACVPNMYKNCTNALAGDNSLSMGCGRYQDCTNLLGIKCTTASSGLRIIVNQNSSYNYSTLYNQIDCFHNCYNLTGSYRLSFRTEDSTNCFKNTLKLETLYFDSFVQTTRYNSKATSKADYTKIEDLDFTNMFYRPEGTKRMNIIFSNQDLYNFIITNELITGCSMSDSSTERGGIITLNYKNETDILYSENVEVVRGCYNSIHNLYIFCTI